MKKTLLLLLALCFAGSAFCCTSIIVGADASTNGRALLWKQRDTSAKYNYMDYFAAKDGCFSFVGLVGSMDTLRKEVWCGTNEKEFSIMNTVAYGLSPIIDENRPWEGIVMKRALEICVTIDDFEDYIKSLPQPNGLETNFGVSDASGNAAYFEVHDLGYTRFDVPRDGYLIRTNFALTGREGEGLGYDRYDLVEAKMKAHKGKYDAQWIFKNLAKEDIVARQTSVASIVMDGKVLWCALGYSRAAYPIPVWITDAIPAPLRNPNGLGCEVNTMAESLKVLTRDTKLEPRLDRLVRRAEAEEFRSFRRLQHCLGNQDIGIDAERIYNLAIAERYEKFKHKVIKLVLD